MKKHQPCLENAKYVSGQWSHDVSVAAHSGVLKWPLDFFVCHHPASIPWPPHKHTNVFELCPLFIVVVDCSTLSYCQADLFTLNGTFPPSLYTSSSELPLSVCLFVSVHPTLILQRLLLSVSVAVCVIFLSVFLSSPVFCAWQPARACYCDSFSSPSWLRLVPWCQQPRVGLLLGVLKQPSCSPRCHQPLLSPRVPSPQSPRGVSISPGYSSSSAVSLLNNPEMPFNFQLCIELICFMFIILQLGNYSGSCVQSRNKKKNLALWKTLTNIDSNPKKNNK